ncbi:MAG: hypothetical protein LQ341_000212 [Variospora aurantia]|nr:MAG: hypothetical protein LQ341_000212 [Variospora aurantia]
MPGRVSARSSSTSQATHIVSSQNLSTRRTAASSRIEIPDEGPSTSLRTRICEIFKDAQRSSAGHRKLATSLRKVQEACCYEIPHAQGKVQEKFEEDDFNLEVARCVIRLLCVKKSESVGDRIVHFLGTFLRRASEKDIALLPEEQVEEKQTLPETPSTRLTAHILSILLPLLDSKEKVVRFRATQLVAQVINSLDSIEDEYYQLIRTGLLKRMRDKEPTIRVQAVLGLGRLAGNETEEDQEEPASDDDDTSSLLRKLLEVLQNDSSADVRRSLLLNLPLTPTTLPFLLERARDVDPAIRRALYSRLLPALGDFRHLSLSMREKLLRWGLRDRDETVRKATGRLFSQRWIEDCAASATAGESKPTAEDIFPNLDGLLELLERIDVVNSATGSGIATEAMREFWSERQDYRHAFIFDDAFWDRLTPESVFVARSFNDFCKEETGTFELLAEEKMPEVTKLAFFLQRYTNDLVNRMRYNNAMTESEEQEDTVEKEFIVEQLLHIAKALDYTDEIGRRKMFSLLRETLAIEELPEEITRLVVDVLSGVCGSEAAGEREFCGIVLEAIAEVHDNVAPDEPLADNNDGSFHSARSELSDSTPTKARSGGSANAAKDDNSEMVEAKAVREIMINIKCLHIAQCMLENVEGSLQQNIHLVTTLNNLVVPAVRSHEAPIRERGLLCLGLCCLLDKALADENLTLFLHCFTKGHDALQVSALHILCDIFTTHSNLLTAETADPALHRSLYRVFSRGLKAAHAPEVQSAATTALCKLMLTSVVEDEDLLKQLVTLFFDPATKDNAAVIQALSYFLPVFCHSKRENMEKMAAVAAAVVHTHVNLADELEEGEEVVSATTVANMLLDWTDTRKLVAQDVAVVTYNGARDTEVKGTNGDVHLTLAETLLERAMTYGCPKEERKTLVNMVGKICIISNSSREKLQTVTDLATEAMDAKIATDTTTRNALNKIHQALCNALGEADSVGRSAEGPNANETVAGHRLGTEDISDVEGTLLKLEEKRTVTPGQDALVDELLLDENEDL